MDCPKCGASGQEGNAICSACGVVFEKYWKYHPRPGEDHTPGSAVSDPRAAASGVDPGFLRHSAGIRPGATRIGLADPEPGGWMSLLLPPPSPTDPLALWGRALLLAVLVIWGVSMMGASVASNAVGESWLHLVNLPFHEAGHIIFGVFGEFIGSLGGTLGQLLMPLICCVVLLLQTRDPFGASVALWWFGQNFLDIAPYINDARAGQLPLLGGNFGHSAPYGFHDWEYLLTETGLIRMDHQIAQASHILGSLIMLLAMVWGGVLIYRQWTAGGGR
jgi:hypothetical protein